MPLLVSLDEYHASLRLIAIHAQLALETPSRQKEALEIIVKICQDTDRTVAVVLQSAIAQLACLLNET